MRKQITKHPKQQRCLTEILIKTFSRSLGGLVLFLLMANLSVFSQNPISLENELPGNPSEEWDITGYGDPTIQGFATQFSINTGGTVEFKVDVDPAVNYSIRIYRLGYYGGLGARLVQDLGSSFAGVAQPEPLYDNNTGRTYCTTWSVSASWTATNAVSGVYIARLTRNDNSGASHIVFVVRDDARSTDILVKTSDATWQAYNAYGGNNFYTEGREVPDFTHAVKGSYDRPFYTRGEGDWGMGPGNWLFNAEYPMIRWLERNGYNISYTTDVDMGRAPLSINPIMHKALFSVGHDEYWSGTARANFETARTNGVHLAFFSGNEVYWKTRWEDEGRTLVCYKEGTMGENTCGTKCDPSSEWTGLWRAPSLPPATDGGKPENALTGQISWYPVVSSIQVPSDYKNLRFWRQTSVALLEDGQTATMPYGTLGYEMDWEQYFNTYPAGRITMSRTVEAGRTHKLSLYRYQPSNAIVFGAGTVQWSWGLDGTHDGLTATPSLAMQQATVNLLADMGVQPETLQEDLFEATASNDAITPVSIINSPLHGASFPANSPIIITGTASDVGGVLAGVDISMDGGLTWQTASGKSNWTFTWIPLTQGTFTVLSHGFDDSGNIEASGSAPAPNAIELTITAPVAPICPCSIWDPLTTIPGNITENDNGAVELGVKFRSTEDGFITGVRFYKGPSNTGTHTGNLWTNTGSNLAQATFINETAYGWQEVTFGSPVQITAGITYIASYHTPVGYYSADAGYFTTNGASSYYLEALADGTDGHNGVYIYSQTTAFPTDSYNATNYYVDVVFVTDIGPDISPPVVTSVIPQNNAPNVSVNSVLTANFNESLDPSTVNTETVLLTGPGAVSISGSVNCNGSIVTFDPEETLAFSTTYTAILKGGVGDDRIKDLAGNALEEDYVWSFSAQGPPPVQGPGGPILVIHSLANPFSLYPIEILRAEGFNEFLAMDISQVNLSVLNDYDVVILGELSLTPSFVTLLTGWVNAGGTLVTLRPDAQLASLLGVTPENSTLIDKYLLINTVSGPGIGLVCETIQYHGTADLYNLNGATSLATLYSDASTATTYPAVTQNLVGENGGKAYAFTYDLAKSVIYTRQGNPAWSGQDRDGIPPIRSNDLFFGNASFDPQPDWIDLDKVEIPQADEQQRLLSNIIIHGNLHKKPLPRFWFLPSGHKAAIVMTGDDHGDSGMQPRFDIDIASSPLGCSVEDWECVRSTGYLYVGSAFTNAMASYYHNLGFEVALHVSTGCASYNATQFENYITSQMTTFHNAFPSIPLPETNRNHCIAWSGYSMPAEVQATNGIRLDVNYYYWPNNWMLNRPGMFTGSGMPMRFAKTDGTLIDCYQVTTQMQDESQYQPYTPYPEFCDALLDKATGPEGYYGVFATNMHFDIPNHPGANAIVASAQNHGIPVVSSKQMLTWLDGRNGSSFESIVRNGDELTFTVNVGSGSLNLRGMLPVISDNGTLINLAQDGSPLTFYNETIKGIEYAFFSATNGDYIATYGTDESGPVITNIIATLFADGTATITWNTDEPADSRVDYDVNTNPLSLFENDDNLVTNHSITLNGLLPNTIYYYRITSMDAFSNISTSPNPPALPLEFMTPSEVCAEDRTVNHFNLGTTGANTLITLEGDGAVTLKPILNEDFSGTNVPSGWTDAVWDGQSGAITTYNGSQVIVNGTHLYYNTVVNPGTAVEFVATFTAGNFQNIGFTGDASFNDPWIVIGRGNAGDNHVYARTNANQTASLGSGLLNEPHKYRIQWSVSTNTFEFYVDDVLKATPGITQAVSTGMVIQISDYPAGGVGLTVDWIRATPYATTGTFTSRVFDADTVKTWGAASWSADVPSGTALQLSQRQSNSEVDILIAPWIVIPINGATIGGSAQYIQYKADFTTSNTALTPVLKDVSINCSTPSNSPPEVTTHPLSQTKCAGETVSFISYASGYPEPTVQWQLSTNGIDWTNINEATSNPLSFAVSTSDDGKQYRAVWSNIVGSISSNPATLTVNSPPTATIAAVNSNLCPDDNIQLKLNSATGASPYILVVNGNTYSGITVNQVFADLNTEERSIWETPIIPENPTANDGQPIELGVKFRSSVSGFIKGIRFYNGDNNSGSYTGKLWKTDGTLLASAAFTNITTNGWQEVRFSNPVNITANTTYIASYFSSSGYYAFTGGGMSATVVNSPLTALASGTEGPNCVYKYGGGFPDGGGNANYFADVVFSEVGDDLTFNLTSVTDNNGCNITGNPISSIAITMNSLPAGTILPTTATVCEGENYNLTFNASVGTGLFSLTINGTTYPNITSGTPFAAGVASYSPIPVSIWNNGAISGNQAVNEELPVELGVRFRSSASGSISGIKFYKGHTDNATYTVNLWNNLGTQQLGTASITTSASGWQEVLFANPVTILADITYVASYYTPIGKYPAANSYFASSGFTSGTLTALGNGVDGPNGVFLYASGGGFPSGSFQSSNYWVDVVFNPSSSISILNLTGITSAAGCISAGNPISTATVKVNSSSTAASSVSGNSSIEAGTSTALTVVGGSLGTDASWKWYSGSCGGTQEGTGTSITVSPLETTDYFVRAEGYCNTTACAQLTVTVTHPMTTWTGASNTDWSVAGNWTNGVPVVYKNAVIPSAPPNQPHVTALPASPAKCRDLTIDAGAIVTIDAGKALTVNGVLTSNAGNSGLVILSDATGTGSLIEKNGVSATVHRYLTGNYPNSNYHWHYVSAPVDNPIAAVFMGMYLTWWDEQAGIWQFITNPNATLSTDMRGYSVRTNNNATAVFTGLLNTGSKLLNVTNTAGGAYQFTGYNLTGNPYPSAIDWNVDDGDGWVRTSVDAAIYIWTGTQYGAYVKDQFYGTNGVDNTIPPHQGFFIHCNSSTGTIGIDNRARIHASDDILKSLEKSWPLIKFKTEGNNNSDEIILSILPESSVNFDRQFDAIKLFGEETAPQLYSVSKDNVELSINSFPVTEEYRIIPIGYKAGVESIYSISAIELYGFNPSIKIILEDLKDNTLTEITKNSTYNFTASPLDENMRFLLHLNGELAVPENLTGTNHIHAYSFNRQVYISSDRNLNGIVYIYDLFGKKIAHEKLYNEMMKKINLTGHKGYMIVNVLSDKGNLNKKIFIR